MLSLQVNREKERRPICVEEHSLGADKYSHREQLHSNRYSIRQTTDVGLSVLATTNTLEHKADSLLWIL